MRISDWSSDVCSSELSQGPGREGRDEDRRRKADGGGIRHRQQVIGREGAVKHSEPNQRPQHEGHRPTGPEMRPPAGGCHYHKAGEEREKAAEKYEDRNRIAVGEMLSQQVQDLEEEDSKQAEADRAAGIASRVGGRDRKSTRLNSSH